MFTHVHGQIEDARNSKKKQSSLKHVLAISKDAIAIDTFFSCRSATDVIVIVEISIASNEIILMSPFDGGVFYSSGKQKLT